MSTPQDTRICLVIGSPVSQSLSPLMHNAGYKALGIDNIFHFKSMEVLPQNLEKELQNFKKQNICGISVTIPHKVSIMQYLDEVSDVAKKIGAVNTVIKKDNKFYGTNTDWIGILNPLQAKIELKGKKAVIFGAGGAARAACYALTFAGAEVTVANRTIEKAEKLAADFNCSFIQSDKVNNLNNYELIINSVPYKSSEAFLPFDIAMLNENHLLFDMVYIPHETTLIKAALSKNAAVIYGVEMLLHQGVEQFKLYTGQEAPLNVMKKTLLNAI